MKITKRKYITTITYDKICNGVKNSCRESFFDKKYVDIRVDEINNCEYDKEYKRTSIRTYLFRLEEKGYLKVEVRKRRAYINVIIDKESYKKEKAGEILEEWFDGSAKELLSAISGNIKKDDTEELKGILDGFDFK